MNHQTETRQPVQAATASNRSALPSDLQHQLNDTPLSLRQPAFAALYASLQSTEPARKPQAVAGIIEDAELEDYIIEPEIPCQDCGGTGGDGNAVEGWEPCPFCDGSGVEPAKPVLLPPAAERRTA